MSDPKAGLTATPSGLPTVVTLAFPGEAVTGFPAKQDVKDMGAGHD